jgi:hypothetical protein
MHKITLEVDGKVYLLSNFSAQVYNRGSKYDPTPNDTVLQFQIRTLKMDQFLWDWFSSVDVVKKNGKVKIINAEENKVVNTISFEEGFSISYNLNFHLNNEYNNEANINLSISKIRIEVNQSTNQPIVPGRDISN